MISGQEITPSIKRFILRPGEDEAVTQINPTDTPADAKAVAEYSAEILTELRDMASGAGLTFLAYLIQVAVEEAKIQASEPEDR